MLEHTVSFWRRLFNNRPRSDASTTATEERRQSARYPAEMLVRCGPAGGDDSGRHVQEAQVRNISRGGLNVILDEKYKPGELLSIELPGTDGHPPITVLACVVHVQELDHRWGLGCTFARELSPEDLRRFAADADLTADQRGRQRYTCDVTASYRLVSENETLPIPAPVLNISTTGIALLLNEPVPVGILLSVDLCPAREGPDKTMLSCVVHVTPQGEQEWVAGCNFITEMSEEALHSLL